MFGRKKKANDCVHIIGIDKGPWFGPLGDEKLSQIANDVGSILAARFGSKILNMSAQIAKDVGKISFVLSVDRISQSESEEITRCVLECLEDHKRRLNH